MSTGGPFGPFADAAWGPPVDTGGYKALIVALYGSGAPAAFSKLGQERQTASASEGTLPSLCRGFLDADTRARATGWLNETFHQNFRELLLHSAAREGLATPAYCLMPDHLHVVWMGLRMSTDQLNAMQFLRKELNRLLSGEALVPRVSITNKRKLRLQHQAHDHVLREQERLRNAFAKTCYYVLHNPVRDELISAARDWPYTGAVMPGYPNLWPFEDDYWPLFGSYTNSSPSKGSRRCKPAEAVPVRSGRNPPVYTGGYDLHRLLRRQGFVQSLLSQPALREKARLAVFCPWVNFSLFGIAFFGRV